MYKLVTSNVNEIVSEGRSSCSLSLRRNYSVSMRNEDNVQTIGFRIVSTKPEISCTEYRYRKL